MGYASFHPSILSKDYLGCGLVETTLDAKIKCLKNFITRLRPIYVCGLLENIWRGEKMKLSKNMLKTAAITIALLIASVMLMAIPVQPVKAQLAEQQPVAGPLPPGVTPNITITTEAYMSFRPNPVGFNQIFLVNIWLHPPIHVRRQFIQAFVVDITKPDGSQITVGPMDSYCGDSTAWFEYIADQEGTWKLKFRFLGMYFPAGHYFEGKVYTAPQSKLGLTSTYLESAYYKPSSTPELELVVKKDYVALSWPPSPLPTDYWTRPVSPENREWWPILGSYPPTGIVGWGEMWDKLYPKTNKYMSNYDFIPYVQAPNTAHIVWKKQYTIGGLIGGPATHITNTIMGLTGFGYPTIIYAGRCYEPVTKVSSTGPSSQTYWQCYDLRTGEIYWQRPLYSGESAPTIVEYALQGEEVPGASARVGRTIYLVAITSPTTTRAGRILKYDPFTGVLSLNLTGPPPGVTAGTLYAYPYVLSIQDLGAAAAPKRYRLINWTIENNAGQWRAAGGGAQLTVDDFKARVKTNVSWPASSLGTCDFEADVAVITSGISHPGTGVSIGQRLIGVRIKDGTVLWNITTDLSTGLETFFSGSTAVADHGKFAVRMQNGQWYCWRLSDGELLWKSEISSWPWGVFAGYDVTSAYGLIFSTDYTGVQAIDWETGKYIWKFTAPAPYPYETPYQVNGTTVYSFHSASVAADGKIYTFTTEHTPSQPITRGWRLFCLNATTGKCIWNITLGQGVPGSRYFQGAIADGYLVHTNEYDGYTYCFGKGKSSTTVSASPKTSAKGSQVLIEGTVLDMSPAQPGTPCVAKESMTVWMEYLHMQKPCPSDVKGVPVTLTAIKSDGKVIDLGTVTTNGFYGTFGFAWTPEEEGTYTIVASFMGDDSYGSSSAATLITVGPAPPEPETPEYPTPTDYTPMFAGIIVAVAIAIVIGIVNLYALRKHK